MKRVLCLSLLCLLPLLHELRWHSLSTGSATATRADITATRADSTATRTDTTATRTNTVYRDGRPRRHWYCAPRRTTCELECSLQMRHRASSVTHTEFS